MIVLPFWQNIRLDRHLVLDLWWFTACTINTIVSSRAIWQHPSSGVIFGTRVLPLDHWRPTRRANRLWSSLRLRSIRSPETHPVRSRVGSASRTFGGLIGGSVNRSGAQRGLVGAGRAGHDLTATMRIYLEAVIGPRTELEDAGLLVEWEVLHVDLAGWLIYGRRLPLDQSLMVDRGLRGQGHLEVAVRAASEHISGSGRCGGRAYFVLPIRYQAVFFIFSFLIYFCTCVYVYMCVLMWLTVSSK